VSWEGLVVAPAASTADQPLWVDVKFRRLVISVRDDPDATLAFAGQIRLTQSGVHIVELNLIEPYPIVLVARTAAALARGAAPILRLAFDLARATAEQAKKMLEILGKIAAAIGRAAVFVGKVAGQAIEGATEVVGKALAGLAEVIAQALRAL